MNSKDKGNIGEAIVLAEFAKRNIQVCILLETMQDMI